MGACVSTPIGGRYGAPSYLAISELSCDTSLFEGQSESKKNGKHILVAGPPNARGGGGGDGVTAKGSMSFGLKKGSTQRQQDKAANKKEYTKIPPPDNNGNSDASTTDTKATSRLVAPRKEQSGQSYRSNRFGFRHANIVRPTTTGLQPKVSDFEEDVNNNHTIGVKEPRSKSAMGRNPTDTLNNNGAVAAAVRQNTMSDMKSTRTMLGKPPIKAPSVDPQLGKKTTTRISIKLHSHSIDTAADKDCSRPTVDTVKKFTLQTTSLPQAEYAVPVSVRTTRVELKNVKQSLNNSRREFLGLNAQNEPIAQQSQFYRGHRVNNQRNLEMVLSGRHKFEVRDLEESTEVVPLNLPKLPSAFDSSAATPLVPTGLIRQDQMRRQESEPPTTTTTSHKESIEEEKLLIDSTITEKGGKNLSSVNEVEEENKMITSNTADSITMKSINTSWSIAGESMMHESQLSTKNKELVEEEEATLNAPSSLAVDSTQKPNPEDTDTEVTLNDVQLDFNDEEATLNEPYESELEQFVKNHNEPLLEDETSPSVSLLTSGSGVVEKEQKKDEEDRLEDTPEPENMKSPSHTSHSSSISEPGRDFLIDDEIADQPGLFSNYKNDSESSELPKAPSNEKALVRSSPLTKHRQQFQIKSKLSPLFAHQSPLMKLRQIQRTESLDTLSPCDSIASDDLMMDFESQSSFESIDRLDETLKEDQVPPVDNEMQLWRELEQQSGELFREWKTILSSATVTNIRNTPPTPSPPPPTQSTVANSSAAAAVLPSSNLPARGTRLLNRSRVQSGLPGCPDSPRSVEQIPRPRRSSSLTKTPSPLQGAVTVSRASGGHSAIATDELSITRSTRNAMIQDVLYFKKQLLRLRRLLQEDEDILKRTDTLNPFEMTNGDISSPNNDNKTSRLLTTYLSMECKSNGVPDNGQEQSGDWNEVDNQQQQQINGTGEEDANNNTFCNAQEMMDMRRQLVYLQSQLDENARTIRIQKNLITKYETEKQHQHPAVKESHKNSSVTIATQTERIRPVSQSRLNGISTSYQVHQESSSQN